MKLSVFILNLYIYDELEEVLLKNDHIKNFIALIQDILHKTLSLPDFNTFTLIIYHNPTNALVSFMAKHAEEQAVVK